MITLDRPWAPPFSGQRRRGAMYQSLAFAPADPTHPLDRQNDRHPFSVKWGSFNRSQLMEVKPSRRVSRFSNVRSHHYFEGCSTCSSLALAPARHAVNSVGGMYFCPPLSLTCEHHSHDTRSDFLEGIRAFLLRSCIEKGVRGNPHTEKEKQPVEAVRIEPARAAVVLAISLKSVTFITL